MLMKKMLLLGTITLIFLSAFSQKQLKIGKQVWMVENLNVYTFKNGDSRPQAKTTEEWMQAGENLQPAWCYYDNDSSNGTKLGKLYNFYAVSDPRGLAPKGYNIPSDADWSMLTNFLGGEKKAGKKMKSISGWELDSIKNGNGTNSSGFEGLPAGFRRYNGSFFKKGQTGIWWSKTEGESNYSWSRFLSNANDFVDRHGDCKRMAGLSVRCLKD